MEKERIFEFIKNAARPVKVGDIQRATGIDRNTVQKVVNQLSVEGKIELDKCYNKIVGLKGESNG